MPRTRHAIARTVAERFLPAKQAAVEAAAIQAETLAALLRGRLAARMQPCEGSDIVSLTILSLDRLVEAQELQQQAHRQLADIRMRWGIPEDEYGEPDTPAVRPTDVTPLKAVA